MGHDFTHIPKINSVLSNGKKAENHFVAVTVPLLAIPPTLA